MFKNFTAQEWITLILAVLGVGYIVLLFINQSWGKLRELAYQGMLIAEQYYHSGEGKQKFEMAFTYLWSLVPRWMKIFITEKSLREKLQEWFDLAKRKLAEGVK